MIKHCSLLDHRGWLPLRNALWSDSSLELDAETENLLRTPTQYQVLTFTDEFENVVGFAESSIRVDYVNGTSSTPVAFLEGLYVQPASRGSGVARQLMGAVEQWARQMGSSELASDALLDNRASHAMHKALGFAETERVVYFLKRLQG